MHTISGENTAEEVTNVGKAGGGGIAICGISGPGIPCMALLG
jgi:hypothetical protein